MITKTEVPGATDIIGIATESGQSGGWSHDVIYLDAREWTPEQQQEAEELRAEFHHNKIMGNQQMFRGVVQEYPTVPMSSSATRNQSATSAMKGSDRNKPCPCGSGRKRKQCCG